MKHTPGPWDVEKTGKVVEIVTGAERSPLAEVFGDDEDSSCWPVSANAHLVAAAPELLAALKDFVAMFIDTKRYPDPETITTGLRIFLPHARAAIAKAEGGE